MSFTEGTRVRVQGLTSEKGKLLNDKTGIITELSPEDRFAIKFDYGTESVAIKGSNLVGLPTPLIFQSEEAFSSLVPGPLNDGYATRHFASLDAPVYLFRADRKQTPAGFVPNAAPVSKEVPMFVSDLDSIRIYTMVPPGSGRMDPKTVSRYTLTKNPVLFDMTPENLDKLLADPKIQTDPTLVALKQWYFVRADLTKAPKTRFPPTLKDLVEQGIVKGTEPAMPVLTPNLQSPGGGSPLYLNRSLSTLLCKLGFDGWVVMPGAFLQRFPLREYMEDPTSYSADFATGSVKFFYTPYRPEVMLCNWDTVSTWAKAFGGRRRKTIRRRRSTRKTRRRA